MPQGNVGVSGYTRRSKTGKVVQVSKYTQKRNLVDQINSLGRSQVAAPAGQMPGGRSIPLSGSISKEQIKAHQKRVAALRLQVDQLRKSNPELARQVESMRKQLDNSVDAKSTRAAKREERKKSLESDKKLTQTRGADPDKLKAATERLAKAVETENNRKIAAEKAKKTREESKKPKHPLASGPETPATYKFVRNPVSATNHAASEVGFGKDIEPAGRYMNLHEGKGEPYVPQGWETGEVRFKKPLRMDFGGGYGESDNWKQRLSDYYDGATGKALSQKLANEGYDAIITSDEHGVSETVDLTSFMPEEDFSTDERWAATEYKATFGGVYADLNNFLRNDDQIPEETVSGLGELELATMRDHLDSAISKRVVKAQTVYRGFISDVFGEEPLMPGTLISDKAFVSTTQLPKVADSFAMEAIMHISIPDGFHALDLEPYSDGRAGHEAELLLPRNVQFEVTDDDFNEKGRRVITVKALMPEGMENASTEEAGQAEVSEDGVNSGVQGPSDMAAGTGDNDSSTGEDSGEAEEVNLSSDDLNALVDDISDSTKEFTAAHEVFAKVYEGTYAGFSVKMHEGVKIQPSFGKEGLNAVLEIFDGTGKKVGMVGRTIHSDGTVNHDSMILDSDKQGQGFAHAFNKAVEDKYRQMGIEKVTLDASWVGSYAWARAGYDWQRFEDPRAIDTTRETIEELLDSISAKAGEMMMESGELDFLDLIESQIEEMLRRVQSAESYDDLPLPYDLTQIGYRPGDENWPGKAGMLDGAWNGEKRL